MRVRMTIHRPMKDLTGRDLQAYPGFEIDLEKEQAVRLIASGQAEAVKVTAEVAVKVPDEAAVTQTPAPNRQKAKKD